MRKMRKSAAVALTAAMAVTSMGVIPAMADETTTIRVMVWEMCIRDSIEPYGHVQLATVIIFIGYVIGN